MLGSVGCDLHHHVGCFLITFMCVTFMADADLHRHGRESPRVGVRARAHNDSFFSLDLHVL